MIRVVILAPIHNSLYARLVIIGLLREKGIDVAGIVVRSLWNFQRFKSEFRRDRSRLIRKVLDKWIRGDSRFGVKSTEDLGELSRRWNLTHKSLKSLAEESNIHYRVVRNHNQIENQNFIEALDPDLIVFTGGGLIKDNILSIPQIGVLNCHTGILPEFRGMDVVEWTAAEGRANDVGFGATLHLMDQGVDTGPILIKSNLNPTKNDSFKSIREKLEVKMVELMIEGVKGFRDNIITSHPQEKNEGRQYYVMHPRVSEFANKKLLDALNRT